MANLPKKKILDNEGNEVLPITHVSAVYNDNGTSVETLLTNMDEKIDNKIIEGYYSNGSFYTAPPITHDYVEINGVKWATMNLGALSETDYGLYFQWGDTQGYTADQIGSGEGQKSFDWNDYKYTNDGGSTIIKYNSTDNKKVLDLEDDAVNAAWGGNWRMPTYNEINLLIHCTWNSKEFGNTDYSGVVGYEVVDTNGNKMFLPCAGFCKETSLNAAGSRSLYLSNSLRSIGSAYYLYLHVNSVYLVEYDYRCLGYSVRGVYDGPTPTVIIPVTDAIYIDKTTNTQYRWDGTAYVQLTKLTYTTIDDEVEDVDETIISQALRKTSQSLTSSEKAQVLTNLGISDLISGSLQKTAQVLSSAEKTLVLTNLGISSAKNITISTSEPTSSDGNNGDIWLVYEAQ